MSTQSLVPRVTQNELLTIVENGAEFNGHKIQIAHELVEEIKGLDPVLFKGVFEKNFLQPIRVTVAEYPYRHTDYRDNGQGLPANFHRRDVFPPWPKPTGRPYRCCAEYFFFFPWNENPAGVDPVVKAVASFRSQLIGETTSGDEAFFGAFTHYPVGGGCIGVHHWYTPEEVLAVPRFNENLVFFTQYGKDYRSGGLHLWREGENRRLHVDPLIEPGDLLCLTSTVGHEILPVDAEKEFDWNPVCGRFLLWVGKHPVSLLREFVSKSAQVSK